MKKLIAAIVLILPLHSQAVVEPTITQPYWELILCATGFGGDSCDPPSVNTTLFYDSFDTYAVQDITGKCRLPGDTECISATFPVEGVDTPGWSLLWTENVGAEPTGQIIDSADCRGGAGKCVLITDSNQHENGPSQWGADFQGAKYFPSNDHADFWVRIYVKAMGSTTVTNQKMFHIFNLDAAELADGVTAFNTGSTTDGGIIANIFEYDTDEWEFRVAIRCTNPTEYKCLAEASGTSTASVSPSAWNGKVMRMQIQSNSACTGITTPTRASVWGSTFHRIDVGLKMNSAKGVADGELEFWYDDCKIGHLDGIAYRESGATEDPSGFNFATFAGNAVPNDWGADNEQAATWIFDDWMICTERCQ